MRVRELIEVLSRCKPELEVKVAIAEPGDPVFDVEAFPVTHTQSETDARGDRVLIVVGAWPARAKGREASHCV